MAASQSRVVLVTGASTGIGREMAVRLAADGHDVAGTSRHPGRYQAPPGVRMLALDVRSDDAVRTCVAEVLATFGRLDVLVNNAGFLQVGALEELSTDEAMHQFDTNLFGVMRMVRSVLPHMRERGRGRIINIGSLSATLAIPFGGIYTASKRALQGYTEALRHEVRPFGVDVCLVEPTFIRTEAAEIARPPDRPMAIYDRARNVANNAWRREIATGPPPRVVADRVASLVKARRTRLRYGAGFEARWLPRARALAPDGLVERLLARRFDLHRTGDVAEDGSAAGGNRGPVF